MRNVKYYDNMHIYDNMSRENMMGYPTFTEEQISEFIDELLSRYPKTKMVVYPDPASRQRKTSAGGRTDLTILQNAGLNVKAKNTHALVRDRINSVNSKLKAFDGKRSMWPGERPY